MSKDTLQTLIQQAEKLTPDEKLSLAAQLEYLALQVDPEVVLRSRRAKIQALLQEILELAAKYGADNLRIFHLSVSEGGVRGVHLTFDIRRLGCRLLPNTTSANNIYCWVSCLNPTYDINIFACYEMYPVRDTEVNFLVNLKPGSGLLEQGGLLMDLRELLGFELYVFTEDDLK